ncbi:MAG: response regulator [Planctomycetota bacterium]|nr:response regulator [Planctomycetota bacterium]
MSLKVLIADPDWRFAGQAGAYLESHAHHVVRESQIPAVLARAEHWHPDLIILAAELAENGLLESLSSLSPRPAILLTGWLDRYDRAWRAWQKGGDELMIKPIWRTSELNEAVATALENAAAGIRRVRGPVAASA